MKVLYIVLDERLTKSQRIPQAAHVVAEFMAEYGQDENVQDWLRNHRTMVCLKADSSTMEGLLCHRQIAEFIDEDLDNMRTAITFQPMPREQGDKLFGHLRLA